MGQIPVKVRVEYEHFLPVSKSRLVQALLHRLGGEAERNRFMEVSRRLELLYHLDYHETLQAMKRDYRFFDDRSFLGNCEGFAAEEIQAAETRFLESFLLVMEKANFRLLSQQELDVANEEDFLFRLPVQIDWGSLDAGLLVRFFEGRTYRGGKRVPEFAKRILIFHRGVGMEVFEGRLLLEKLDYLVGKLLKKVLHLVYPGSRERISASPRPEASYDAQCGLEETTVPDGGASRGVGSGQAGKASATIHGVRYLQRVCLRHTGVRLGNLFSRVRLQEPTFQELVLLFRPSKEKLPEPAKGGVRPIVIKTFRDIPMADLEVVFPDKKLSMQPVDLIKLSVTGLTGFFIVAFKIARAAVLSPVMAFIVLFSAMGYGAKVLFGYKSAKDRYESLVTHSLYDKSLDNGRGVLCYLVDALEEEEFKEAILALFFLWEAGPQTKEDLDVLCERFLHDEFGIQVDFEIDDALQKLMDSGLVSTAHRLVVAKSPKDILGILARHWEKRPQGTEI